MLKENTIHLGDCLDLMPSIPSKSVDMILCDLPYGTTDCSWDRVIDLSVLWQQYERVIKDNSAIVLTANRQFTFALYNSNPKIYRYKWIYLKSLKTNFLNANKQPLCQHEEVLIFYKNQPCYNPQMTKGKPYKREHPNSKLSGDSVYINDQLIRSTTENNGDYFPSDVIQFKQHNGFTWHPTQKPVALFEYLIKTYTNEGELILDNCSGSGTTAIACMNTNRRFICIERDETYHRKSIERISNHEPLFHLGGK